MTKFTSDYVQPTRCFGTPCSDETPFFDGPMCESVWPDSVQPSRAGEASIVYPADVATPQMARTDFVHS